MFQCCENYQPIAKYPNTMIAIMLLKTYMFQCCEKYQLIPINYKYHGSKKQHDMLLKTNKKNKTKKTFFNVLFDQQFNFFLLSVHLSPTTITTTMLHFLLRQTYYSLCPFPTNDGSNKHNNNTQ